FRVVAAKEEVDRHLGQIEGSMVAWPGAALALFELEVKLAIGLVQKRLEILRRSDAADDQLVLLRLFVLPDAADHVHVEHGDGALERKRRLVAVVKRAEQSPLLAGEGDEPEPPAFAVRLCTVSPCEFEERRGPGRVVVGPVVDGGTPEVLGPPLSATEVVVV